MIHGRLRWEIVGPNLRPSCSGAKVVVRSLNVPTEVLALFHKSRMFPSLEVGMYVPYVDVLSTIFSCWTMPSLLATIWYMDGPYLRIYRPSLLSYNQGDISILGNDNKSDLGAKVKRKRNITKDQPLARVSRLLSRSP